MFVKCRGIKVLMGMFVFLVLAVVVTTILIFHERNSQAVFASEIPEISLFGTYDENSISLEKFSFTRENGCEGFYYQIGGLKNKKVENDVNQRLQEDAYRLADYYSADTYQNQKLEQKIISNFSNVICVETCVTANSMNPHEDGTQDYVSKTEHHSFNFINGQEIKVQDLWMDDTDLLAMISSQIYEDLVWDKKWEIDSSLEFYDPYAVNHVNEIDENQFISSVKSFSDAIANGTLDFEFDPQCVEMSVGSLQQIIWFKNCIPDVAIYTRFLTKDSLYEDDSLGAKDLFNFSIRTSSNDFLFSNYGPQTDNLLLNSRFVDLRETITESPTIQQAIQNTITQEQQEIENEIALAHQNPSQKIYTEMQYTLEVYLDTIIAVKENYQSYRMDASYYDHTFVEKLATYYQDTNRWSENDYMISVVLEENEPIEKTESFSRHFYSVKTGKELKELRDFFVAGYDYEDTLKNVFFKDLVNIQREKQGLPAITDEELETLYQNTRFVFDGYGSGFYVINSTIGNVYGDPASDYCYSDYMIYFNQFDPNVLAI